MERAIFAEQLAGLVSNFAKHEFKNPKTLVLMWVTSFFPALLIGYN
jgi:hypothetical protein